MIIEYIKNVSIDFWHTALEMAPYLLFGFAVAGLLHAFVSRRFVETHLGGRGLLPVVKASLFGVPLPLCSCSVIPVSMSLRKHGASKGSTISFLLSTPQTGVDSIFVTLSLLGPVFAVFRPVVAFVTGIVGGFFVDTFARDSADSNLNLSEEKSNCDCGCEQEEKLSSKLVRGLRYAFITLPHEIGRAILVGLAVAALITALVPDNFFADKLGTGILPMLVMMLLGIPVYVCATASVPVAAAMILKGLTPGAAFVFLMTGPATNAASIAAIWKILGRQTALIYLAAVAGCALLSGILLDFIAVSVNINVVSQPMAMMHPAIQYASAAVLAAILAGAFFKSRTTNH